MNKPLSSKVKPTHVVGFFVLFGLIGLAVLIPLFILPCVKIIQARGWNATPCVIVSSSVRTHYGSKGDTYSVGIVYEYVVSGRESTGVRYQFLSGSSSGYSGKQEIVRRYPPRKRAVC